MPLLRKYLPILLALAVALWIVDHLEGILRRAGVDEATLGGPLFRVLDALPLSEVLGLALVVVAGVWLVKWWRHRTLVHEIEGAVRRKAAIQKILEHTAAKEAATATPSATPSATPAAPPPPHQEPRVVFGPGERQRIAADRARSSAAGQPQASAAELVGAQEKLRNDLAMAQTLLASHLATTLALQGVKAPPPRTAELLMAAREGILADPGAAAGQRGRDLTSTYLLAARMAEEVRTRILGSAEFRADGALRGLADALVDTHRVLIEGPGGSWGKGTVEGFVRDSDPGRSPRNETTDFARAHGPLGKMVGGITSRQLSRRRPAPSATETVPASGSVRPVGEKPAAAPAESGSTYHYTPKKKGC